MWAILKLSKTTYTSLYFWEVIHNHILYLPQSHDNGNFVIDFSDFDFFFTYERWIKRWVIVILGVVYFIISLHGA